MPQPTSAAVVQRLLDRCRAFHAAYGADSDAPGVDQNCMAEHYLRQALDALRGLEASRSDSHPHAPQ